MTIRERFFYDNAGYSWASSIGETENDGRLRCARELAAAETWGEENEIECLWEGDSEPYELGDAEDTMPEEVLLAYLYHRPTRRVLPFSLGGIGDPTNDFMRVVAAELLLDAQEAGIVFPQCATA